MTARTLPDDDKRDQKLTVRFTAEQRAVFEQAAGGLSLGAWAYGVLLEAAEIQDTARRAAPRTPNRERQDEGQGSGEEQRP